MTKINTETVHFTRKSFEKKRQLLLYGSSYAKSFVCVGK